MDGHGDRGENCEEPADHGESEGPGGLVYVRSWHPGPVLPHHAAEHCDGHPYAATCQSHQNCGQTFAGGIFSVAAGGRKKCEATDVENDREGHQGLDGLEPGWQDPLSYVVVLLVEDPPASIVCLANVVCCVLKAIKTCLPKSQSLEQPSLSFRHEPVASGKGHTAQHETDHVKDEG